MQTTQLDMLPRMSITVIITRDDNGAPLTREIYEEGARFKVENGELNIISGSPELVALYGSGNWLSVHMDDHVAVVTTKPPEDDSGSGDMDFGLGDLDSSDSDDDTDTSTDDVDTESTDLDADSTESDTETVESDDADPTE